MQAAFQAVSASIGRALSYAGTFATFLAGRFVSGMAMAAASVVAFNAKLLLTRAALMRTGIGALIVGVGEVIYRFGGLVDATGGVGAAFDALKAVAIEAWERIADGPHLVELAVRQMSWSIRADFLGAIATMHERWSGFIGDIAKIGSMIPGLGMSFRSLSSAIGDSGTSIEALRHESELASEYAANFGTQVEGLGKNMKRQLASWGALRAKLAEARAEMDNSGTSSQDLAAALDDLNAALSGTDSKGGGAGVDTVTRKVAGLESAAERASGSFNTFFKDMIKGSGDAGDAISALADRMLDDLLDRAMSPLSDALGSMFDGLLSG
ncbi:hypothetical protein JMJ94_21860, partial [Rhodovulum visakhapatnamense]|nr:hypothetical protein [Rhodovulum visakhapatnamense]MBL3580754.1 hypothetical protein [Rhodovulum visakhapatnamense]